MNWLRKFAGTVGDYVSSKKVITAALTVVVSAVVKDPELRDKIVYAGLALLGAQGAADFGKAAKK